MYTSKDLNHDRLRKFIKNQYVKSFCCRKLNIIINKIQEYYLSINHLTIRL